MQIEVLQRDTPIGLAATVIDNFKTAFLTSPERYVAFDTETMGKTWFERDRALQELEKIAPRDKEVEKLIKRATKDRDAVKGDASDHNKNILAVAQFAISDSYALVVVLDEPSMNDLACALLKWFALQKATIIIHNAQFDCTQVRHHWGVDLHGADVVDTMLQETLIQGMLSTKSARLMDCGPRYGLPEEICKSGTTETFSNWFDRFGPEQLAYASKDVLCLIPLHKAQLQAIELRGLKRAAALENALPTVLARLNDEGLRFDKDKLDRFLMDAVQVQASLKTTAGQLFGAANLMSSAEVLSVLKAKFDTTPTQIRWDKDLKVFTEKPSADKIALLGAGLMQYPEVKAYVQFKELSGRIKLARDWRETGGRQRVTLFQLPTRGGAGDGEDKGAKTGRMSASPRLQNIPNFMKQFVVAPDDWVILSTDYAAIQLRILAMFTQDPGLLNAFNNDLKLHNLTCEWAFGVPYAEVDKKAPYYRVAKEINFGLPFGMGPRKLAAMVFKGTDGELQLTDEEAYTYWNGYFDRHPNVKRWQEKVLGLGLTTGVTYSASGRYRLYDDAQRKAGAEEYRGFWHNKQYIDPRHCHATDLKACYHAADFGWKNVCYNNPIQGTEADGLKAALRLLEDNCDRRTMRLFATVHDSIDSLVHVDHIDQAVRVQNDAMIQGMEQFVKGVKIAVEHTVGRCWASLPKDYATVDHGLWQVEGYSNNEFQRDITIK